MTVKRGGRGPGHVCRVSGHAGDGAASSTAVFTISASQPASFTTSNGNSASVPFTAGRAVVFATQGLQPSGVSIVGAGAGASDVACTKVATSAANDFGIWVSNADIAAGSYPVKCASSGGSASWTLVCGTLSGASAPTVPSSTALKEPSGSYSFPCSTSSAITIPTNGVGVLFGTSSAGLASSNITLVYQESAVRFGGSLATPGAITPQIVSSGAGSGFIRMIAATWGP